MRRTRGSGWRACLRAQTTQCSCRRPRMPRGAASPPPPSPQVSDWLPLSCLLPCVTSGPSGGAFAMDTGSRRRPSKKLSCLLHSCPSPLIPARSFVLPRQPEGPQCISLVYLDQLNAPSKDIRFLFRFSFSVFPAVCSSSFPCRL